MPYYYWSKKMLALFLNLRGSKYIFLLKKKKKMRLWRVFAV